MYASDHEPFSRHLVSGKGEIRGQDRRHCEFLTGADLVIHDAQFTLNEYASKIGWGHSTVDYAIAMSREAKAARLALTHHDPLRTDDAIDTLAMTNATCYRPWKSSQQPRDKVLNCEGAIRR